MGPEDHHEPPLDPEAYELWMIETRNAAILDEIEKLSNGEIQCDSTNELEAADVACQRVVKLVQELRFSLPAYARGCQWKAARPSKEAPAPLDTEVRSGQREAPDLCGVDGMNYKLCEECGQPTKPGRHKPGEYEHAKGCPNAPPKALEQIADVVLNYRPKSKQPKPRKRKRRKQNVVERGSTR